MKVDKVSLELVEYKYLILAAFLGRGLIKDWLDALPDASFRKEAFDVLGKFEDEFQRCFECVRTKYGRPSVLIVKNDFYVLDFPSRMPLTSKLPKIIEKSLNIQPKEVFSFHPISAGSIYCIWFPCLGSRQALVAHNTPFQRPDQHIQSRCKECFFKG